MMDDREKGRRLLKSLLPWARAELGKEGGKMGFTEASPLGKSFFPLVTEDDLDALMIHPGPKGGWHADLLLRNVPAGRPNTMGTPVGQPLRTRAEAEEIGKRLLVAALAICKGNAATPKSSEPVFMLKDYTFPLIPMLLKAASQNKLQYGTPFQAAIQVELMLDALRTDGFILDDLTTEQFEEWPAEAKARLWGTIHRAVVSGLFVYPMREDKPPGEG